MSRRKAIVVLMSILAFTSFTFALKSIGLRTDLSPLTAHAEFVHPFSKPEPHLVASSPSQTHINYLELLGEAPSGEQRLGSEKDLEPKGRQEEHITINSKVNNRNLL